MMSPANRVYEKLCMVPSGMVTTYGELARAAGMENGQRAVGRIMNKNPYPGIVPCHRVVMSDGKIGGYAYGEEVKRRMLDAEGVRVSGGRIIDFENVLFRF